MKILLVADQESRYIWDFYDPKRFEDIDFILSAGDLKASYMEFLTTVTLKPLYYIHGNHDTRYLEKPPGGCICIDDEVIIIKGLRIMGLGGSMRYKEGPLQYTEAEMIKRVKKLKKKVEKVSGLDIILTHAPAAGLGDGKDLCHNGFEIFNELIRIYNPSYFLHGHQHLNYNLHAKRLREVNHTKIINGFEYHIFEFEDNQLNYNRRVDPQPNLKKPSIKGKAHVQLKD